MIHIIAIIMMLSCIMNVILITRSNFNSRKHLDARRKIAEQMLEYNKKHKE